MKTSGYERTKELAQQLGESGQLAYTQNKDKIVLYGSKYMYTGNSWQAVQNDLHLKLPQLSTIK